MFHSLEKKPSPLIGKVNPKVKLLYFIFLLLLALSSKNLSFLALLFFFHLGLIFLLGLSLREVPKILAEPLVMATILVLIKAIKFNPFYVDTLSLQEGLVIALRILASFSLFLFFYLVTTFSEILALLNWLRIPLLLQELIYLTFRFVLLLHQEIYAIYLSQRNRLGYVNFRTSLRSLSSLIKGAFFQTLKHCEDTLQAMYQRGYDYKNLLILLPAIPHRDWFFLLSSLTLWGSLWILL